MSGNKLNPKASLKRHEKSAFRVYDGQAMIVLSDRSEIKVLNEVGSRIWELLDGTTSAEQIVEQIVEKITDEFEVSDEVARLDAMDFLSELFDNGMVVAN